MDTPSATQYFVQFPEKVSGPFSLEQLQKLVARGRLSPADQISKDRKDWQPATTLAGIDFTVFRAEPESAASTAFCLVCGASLPALTTECAKCGDKFTYKEQAPARQDLQRIATSQRTLMVAFVVAVPTVFVYLTLLLYTGWSLLTQNVGLASIPIWVGCMVAAYKLAREFNTALEAVAWSLLLLLPIIFPFIFRFLLYYIVFEERSITFLNARILISLAWTTPLVVILVLLRAATRSLQRNGVRVGLFGAALKPVGDDRPRHDRQPTN